MRRAAKVPAGLGLALFVCSTLHAQDDHADKINTNLGGAVSLPLNPTSKFVNTSWGLSAGAGYNFSPHHSVIGECMLNATVRSVSRGQLLQAVTSSVRHPGCGGDSAVPPEW
jgi:hypothetical protein